MDVEKNMGRSAVEITSTRRHLEGRIEAFIAGYEATRQPPDCFAGEYLVRALATAPAGVLANCAPRTPR